LKVPPARAALCALLLLSACKVELTPEEYFDHRGTARDQGETGAAEVRDRVLAMGQALSRGSARDALSALAPSGDAYIFGMVEGSGGDLPAHAEGQLEALAGRVQPLSPDAVVLRQGPTGNVVWFRTRLVPQDEDRGEVRVTGVYVLREGIWNLVQAHFSTAAQGDSATADPQAQGSYRAPAGTRAAGE
jgi:hypothetical protein